MGFCHALRGEVGTNFSAKCRKKYFRFARLLGFTATQIQRKLYKRTVSAFFDMEDALSFVVSIDGRFIDALPDLTNAEQIALGSPGQVRCIEVFAAGVRLTSYCWQEEGKLWRRITRQRPLAAV